jgi:hypothetical protein
MLLSVWPEQVFWKMEKGMNPDLEEYLKHFATLSESEREIRLIVALRYLEALIVQSEWFKVVAPQVEAPKQLQ